MADDDLLIANAAAAQGGLAGPDLRKPRTQEEAAAALDGTVHNVLSTVIRGLVVMAPTFAPPVLLRLIAWRFGVLLADLYTVDTISNATIIRKSIIDAFTEGVKSIKIKTQPAPETTMDTARLMQQVRGQ